MIEVVAKGKVLSFNTYDAQKNKDDLTLDLGDDYYGKTFDIAVAWDLEGEPIKKIYVDGALKKENKPTIIPSRSHKRFFIGSLNAVELGDNPAY